MVTQNEWPFIMQGSDTMDYYFTRGEDRSEQIKKQHKALLTMQMILWINMIF